MPTIPFWTIPSSALRPVVAIGLAMAALAAALPVAAQDAEEQRMPLTAGPYLLDVAVSQDRGDVHFTITVEDASTRELVSDATVQVLAENEDAGLRWTLRAGSIAPGRYRADVQFEPLGRWEPTVQITGPLGEGAVALPPLELSTPTGSTGASYLFIGIVAVLTGGAFYVWWSARREQRKQQLSNEGRVSDGPTAT